MADNSWSPLEEKAMSTVRDDVFKKKEAMMKLSASIESLCQTQKPYNDIVRAQSQQKKAF